MTQQLFTSASLTGRATATGARRECDAGEVMHQQDAKCVGSPGQRQSETCVGELLDGQQPIAERLLMPHAHQVCEDHLASVQGLCQPWPAA